MKKILNKILNKIEKFKILDKLKNLDRIKLDNKKIALIMVASITVLYLDFAFVISGQLNRIKSTGPSIAKIKKDLDTLTQGLLRMQAIKNKFKQAGGGLEEEAKTIINEEEISSLLHEISNLANKNNVQVIKMKPVRKAPDPKAKPSAVSKFEPFTISLDLLSGYHELGKFINELENAKIFVAIDTIKISAEKNDFLNQKVTLELKSFLSK